MMLFLPFSPGAVVMLDA